MAACWVVTGGARGITFAIVRELAARIGQKNNQKCGHKFILIGRAAPVLSDEWRDIWERDRAHFRTRVIESVQREHPKATLAFCLEREAALIQQIELSQNLASLGPLGVDGEYVALDGCDEAGVAAFWQGLCERYPEGDFRLIHGAAINRERRLVDQDLSVWKAVFDAKVKTLVNFLKASRETARPFREIFLFGSVASYIGGFGQTDYGAANTLFSSLAGMASQLLPHTRLLCLSFPAWDTVGMSVRPHTKKFFTSIGFPYLSLEEGVRLSADLILSPDARGEIVIGSPALFDSIAKLYGRPSLEGDKKTEPKSEVPTGGGDSLQFVSRFTAEDDVIRNHSASQLGALLPGAGYIAKLIGYFREAYPHQRLVAIRNLAWKLPFTVRGDSELLCRVTPMTRDRLRFQFFRVGESAVYCDGLIECTDRVGEKAVAPSRLIFPDIRGMETVSPESLYAKLRGAEYFHGGSFRCVRAIWRSDEAVLSHLRVDEPDRFKRLTYLLDGVAQTRGLVEGIGMPCRIRALHLYADDFGEDLYVYAPLKTYQSDFPLSSLDLAVFNAKRELVASYDQFKIFQRDPAA